MLSPVVWKEYTDFSVEGGAYSACLSSFSKLKLEALCSSLRSVNFHQITLQKSYKIFIMLSPSSEPRFHWDQYRFF
jgi:hypothetical protein